MSRIIELPEPVYLALRDAAEASGISPAAWIAAQVGAPTEPGSGPTARTLAELFAGRVGQIASGGREPLSEGAGEAFVEHLEAKRRAGHL
jgi:hypothetical protein